MALDRQLQIRDAAVAREAHFLRQSVGIDRREALRAWRAEAAKLLSATFTWPADPARRARLIGQCIGELEVLAQALFDRGWLVEQPRLLEMVRACITPIAAAQAAGKIADFWPYFRRSVRAYVPVNAEELQRVSRRDGATASQWAASALAVASGLLAAPKVSPVEAIGERRAEARQASGNAPARGRPRKFKAAEDATLPLF